MEQYTDDERVEDLKKWWAENGASILIGIVLGLVAIFGWQYWNKHRTAQAEAASQAYDTFVQTAEKSENATARERAQTLFNDFPKSPYAVLAALRLAKLAMDSNDIVTAAQQLEWVISNAQLDEFKDIARLRLAKVQFAAGKTVEAQALLDKVTTASLAAERDALKGDFYLAANDREKARLAYSAALAVEGDNRLLQLKLDNLAVPTPETVIPAPLPPPAPPITETPKPSESTTAATPPESTKPAEPVVSPPPAEGEQSQTVVPSEGVAKPTEVTQPVEITPQVASPSPEGETLPVEPPAVNPPAPTSAEPTPSAESAPSTPAPAEPTPVLRDKGDTAIPEPSTEQSP